MRHGPELHGLILVVLVVGLVAVAFGRALRSELRKVRDRKGRVAKVAGGTRRATQPAKNGVVTGRNRSGAGPVEPGGAVVRLAGLTKRYGEFLALDQLTFSLERGTITGFLGPNGAGKTTTLRLLLGLAEPTAGEALVLGERYVELDEPTGRVGAVLESGDFHPGRTGRDHLRILALAADLPSSRVDDVLDLVAIGPASSRPVRTYSLGMRQRLGLAAALLGDPELLVLDEPANGLDPVGVHWLRTFLRGFADGGGTVLVSSHVLAEVAQTVDRVVIIDRGRLVADASLDELADPGQSLEDAYLALTAGAIS